MTKCGQIVAKYDPNIAKFAHTGLSGQRNPLGFIQDPSISIKIPFCVKISNNHLWTIRMKSAFNFFRGVQKTALRANVVLPYPYIYNLLKGRTPAYAAETVWPFYSG